MSRRIRRALVALIAAAACSACDRPPRLDFTSDEALRASNDAIAAALPEEERDRFLEAALVVTRDITGGAPILKVTPEMQRRLREVLEGRTAAEVIALADEVRRRAPAAGTTPAPTSAANDAR